MEDDLNAGSAASEAVGESQETDLDTSRADAVDGEGGEGEGDEDDSFELEHAGAKHKIPAVLRDVVLSTQDLTAKAQTHAEAVKTHEAAVAQHQARIAADQEFIEDLPRHRALQDQIDWYTSLDWTALQGRDPEKTTEMWMAFQQLKLKADAATKALDEKKQAREKDQTEQVQKTFNGTMAELADPLKGIKGWGPDKFRELATFAIESGVSEDAVKFADASQWRLLNLAKIGADTVKAQTRTANVSKAQAAQPAATVAARKAAPTGLSDDLSTEEWMRRRNAKARAA